jgi:hypothetical protein
MSRRYADAPIAIAQPSDRALRNAESEPRKNDAVDYAKHKKATPIIKTPLGHRHAVQRGVPYKEASAIHQPAVPHMARLSAHSTIENFDSQLFSNRMPGNFHTHTPNRASVHDRHDSRCEYRV